MRPSRVIITGGIASGKSTILREWESAGIRVAQADEIAREVFDTPEVQGEIKRKIGSADRDAVRHAVGADAALRAWLNALIHPRVYARILRSRAQAIEIPLMMEACLWSVADRVVVAWCPLDLVRDRVKNRGLDEREVDALIAMQVHPDARLPFADEILRTNEPLDRVLADARQLANRLFAKK